MRTLASLCLATALTAAAGIPASAADRITIVDFKSNTVVPKSADQVPEGILRQMGAYVAALRQVYPGRSVQPFILWTRSAQLMPLAPDIMSAALDRAAIP